jgi:hypothetical protein
VASFLRDEAANLGDVSGSEAVELRALMADPAPYKGNLLQQAKIRLETLRTKVGEVVNGARAAAIQRIDGAAAALAATPEFAGLSGDEQAAVRAQFAAVTEQVQRERLAPVIRQLADRACSELLPRQLQELSALVAKKKGQGGGAGGKAVEYVSIRSIPVPCAQSVLSNPQDLDAYLAAARTAYAEVLAQNKRITL